MYELMVLARRENVTQVVDFVMTLLDDMGCDDKIKMQFSVAIDEIFVNIASYAYNHNNGKAIVKCYVNYEPLEFKIEFIDEGKAFNPLEKDDPDFGVALEDMQIGGLGIFMVKKLMDSVAYERQDNKNIFTVSKKC